jgi:23S rRNA pseudouridine1911/1915/1917 synthase
LETGRTHQIRAHLLAIGHPVVGDPEYGGALRIPGLERQFLHSAQIGFEHPVSGATVQVRAPLPEDLEEALRLASGERGYPTE